MAKNVGLIPAFIHTTLTISEDKLQQAMYARLLYRLKCIKEYAAKIFVDLKQVDVFGV